jgi:hypothetical protein
MALLDCSMNPGTRLSPGRSALPFGCDVAAKVHIQFAGDLEVMSGPGIVILSQGGGGPKAK